MQETPFLSIVIAAYNVEQYLPATLESIAPLSNDARVEVVAVDDGSTDATPRLLDAWCEGRARCRCVHQPNRGVSAARNKGISLSSGRFLWFVDADDKIFAPEALALMDRVASQNVDLVWFNYFNKYRTGGTQGPSSSGHAREHVLSRALALALVLWSRHALGLLATAQHPRSQCLTLS